MPYTQEWEGVSSYRSCPGQGKRECQSEVKENARDQRRAAAPSGDDHPDMAQPLYATNPGSYSPSVVSPRELSERGAIRYFPL